MRCSLRIDRWSFSNLIFDPDFVVTPVQIASGVARNGLYSSITNDNAIVEMASRYLYNKKCVILRLTMNSSYISASHGARVFQIELRRRFNFAIFLRRISSNAAAVPQKNPIQAVY